MREECSKEMGTLGKTREHGSDYRTFVRLLGSPL